METGKSTGVRLREFRVLPGWRLGTVTRHARRRLRKPGMQFGGTPGLLTPSSFGAVVPSLGQLLGWRPLIGTTTVHPGAVRCKTGKIRDQGSTREETASSHKTKILRGVACRHVEKGINPKNVYRDRGFSSEA